jgi:hypothetical protein
VPGGSVTSSLVIDCLSGGGFASGPFTGLKNGNEIVERGKLALDPCQFTGDFAT